MTLLRNERDGCPEFRRLAVNRRTCLKVGALGAVGLPGLLQAESNSAVRKGKATAKSVILLFQFGGPSHFETFDPKPDAPREIRGEFKPIDSNVPGIQVCEHLPQLARLADKYSLVRSVHHTSSSHNPGAYHSLVGVRPPINIVTLNAAATDFPHPGSILDYLDREKRPVPAFVSLPHMIADGPFRTPGEFAGFLGKMYDPLWVLKDPNSADFKVNELSLPGEVDVQRIHDRKAILDSLAAVSKLGDKAAAVSGMAAYQQRALDLLSSPSTQKAFAIQEEDQKVRDRYGRHTYGQSVLLARRLVEAGVRFVTVYYSRGIRGWDTHDEIFPTMKDKLLPHTDQAVSALLADLSERGLLDETLVYWTGDFGRTPKINDKAGRDHWPPCQTVLMAGGGIAGGRVHGSSDAGGAYPHDNPAGPEDVTATIFHAMGFSPETMIRDQLGRPMPISHGRPLSPLFA